MGDKNSDTRAEALTLISERMPQRLAAMDDEGSWAVGLKRLPRGHTPPIWVRRVIYEIFGIPHARAQPLEKITPAAFAAVMGHLSALAEGGRILLKTPLDTSGLGDDAKFAALEFQRRMGDATRPHFERAEDFLAKHSPKEYRSTRETITAFHAAESKTVDAIFADEEGPLSTEICFFLWIFWAEVKTANSVRELHEWFTGLGMLNCGIKNFEKICRKIGYRGSTRGRRKAR